MDPKFDVNNALANINYTYKVVHKRIQLQQHLHARHIDEMTRCYHHEVWQAPHHNTRLWLRRIKIPYDQQKYEPIAPAETIVARTIGVPQVLLGSGAWSIQVPKTWIEKCWYVQLWSKLVTINHLRYKLASTSLVFMTCIFGIRHSPLLHFSNYFLSPCHPAFAIITNLHVSIHHSWIVVHNITKNDRGYPSMLCHRLL